MKKQDILLRYDAVNSVATSITFENRLRNKKHFDVLNEASKCFMIL